MAEVESRRDEAVVCAGGAGEVDRNVAGVLVLPTRVAAVEQWADEGNKDEDEFGVCDEERKGKGGGGSAIVAWPRVIRWAVRLSLFD
jgi:hypothetical protein